MYITKKDLAVLKEVRESATMERAGFGMPEDRVTWSGGFNGEGSAHPTEYIREQTRLYRESWIIAPLDKLIAKLEAAQ